ncbi:hypothetical protein D3C75_1264000 [compost metagenome]
MQRTQPPFTCSPYREPAEPDTEEQNQKDANPEDWHTESNSRKNTDQMIQQFILMCGCNNSKNKCSNNRKNTGYQNEQ